MINYKFGDKLKYISPMIDNFKTPCVYLRDDNGKAVIMFRNAEWCARVNYRHLEEFEIAKERLNNT